MPPGNKTDSPPATVLPTALEPVRAPPQIQQNGHQGLLARSMAAIFNVIMPSQVRESWLTFLTTTYNKIKQLLYHIATIFLIILIIATEIDDPGYWPHPPELCNAAIGFSCAIALILTTAAAGDFLETQKWPWEENDWVTWLWGCTIHDDVDEITASLIHDEVEPAMRSDSRMSDPAITPPVQSHGHLSTSLLDDQQAQGQDVSLESSTTLTSTPNDIAFFQRPHKSFNIRRNFALRPTDSPVHSSGLLGASPVTRRRVMKQPWTENQWEEGGNHGEEV